MDLNNFVVKGLQFANRGLFEDNNGNEQEAMRLYLTAIQYLLIGKNDSSQVTQEKIRIQIQYLVERGEEIHANWLQKRSLSSPIGRSSSPILNQRIEESRLNSSPQKIGSWFGSNPKGPELNNKGLNIWENLEGGTVDIGENIVKTFSFKDTAKVITSKDSNYSEMEAMQMGIRLSLDNGHTQHIFICVDNFSQSHEFHVTNSQTHRYIVKLYAPAVFSNLRTAFGTNNLHFMRSIVNSSLYMLKSPGKSASFLYFSADFKYLIKTINQNEAEFFQGFLVAYYYYAILHPFMLISRIFGFYSMQEELSGKTIYFVIMENILNTDLPISKCYDLKGSKLGRFASEEEKNKPGVILKDLDVAPGTFKLSMDYRQGFFDQLHKDSIFLEKNEIMDYSLLVGVHEMQPTIDYRMNSHIHDISPFTRYHGGVPSKDRQCIYFFGIIDIFTPYGWKKALENSWKSLFNEPSDISAVNPVLYSERFEFFFDNVCFER